MDDILIPLPDIPTRFMDRLRAFMRAKHLAYRTEKTYCGWILDFIRYHQRKHPEAMGAAEVDAWLSYLANNRNVSINTQKTALSARTTKYFHQTRNVDKFAACAQQATSCTSPLRYKQHFSPQQELDR